MASAVTGIPGNLDGNLSLASLGDVVSQTIKQSLDQQQRLKDEISALKEAHKNYERENKSLKDEVVKFKKDQESRTNIILDYERLKKEVEKCKTEAEANRALAEGWKASSDKFERRACRFAKAFTDPIMKEIEGLASDQRDAGRFWSGNPLRPVGSNMFPLRRTLGHASHSDEEDDLYLDEVDQNTNRNGPQPVGGTSLSQRRTEDTSMDDLTINSTRGRVITPTPQTSSSEQNIQVDKDKAQPVKPPARDPSTGRFASPNGFPLPQKLSRKLAQNQTGTTAKSPNAGQTVPKTPQAGSPNAADASGPSKFALPTPDASPSANYPSPPSSSTPTPELNKRPLSISASEERPKKRVRAPKDVRPVLIAYAESHSRAGSAVIKGEGGSAAKRARGGGLKPFGTAFPQKLLDKLRPTDYEAPVYAWKENPKWFINDIAPSM